MILEDESTFFLFKYQVSDQCPPFLFLLEIGK